MSRDKSSKKPSLVKIKKPDGTIHLRIQDAGVAGKIFQHRIEGDKVEFVRVVPHGGYWGTLKDPNIALSRHDAEKNNLSTFLSNSTILDSEDYDDTLEEVRKNFPKIYQKCHSKKGVIRVEMV